MKTPFLFIFACCFAAQALAQSIDYDRKYFSVFPELAKVIEHYAKMDTAFLRESSALYEWEKRYDGWYVMKRNPAKPSQAIRYLLLWSAKKKSWMRDPAIMPVALSAEQQKLLQQHVAKQSQARQYNTCPVFGYEGYEKEVLRWLEGRELIETECECLMQVYGSLLYRYWLFDEGKQGRWSKYDSTFAVADIRPEAMDSVQSIARRWQQTTARLLKLQPDYWLGSSSAASKAQHDKMAVYSDFMLWRKTDKVQDLLGEVRYDSLVLQTAKNILSSCPQKAILFSQSEHAFYPLVYAQERLGLRKDVVLVYMPLLNLGRYIAYLEEEKKLSFSLPKIHYQYQNGKIWRVQWDTTARDFRAFASKMPAKAMSNPADYILPSPRWWLDTEKKTRFQWRQQICIQENIAFLDILANRNAEQPVCFVMDMQSQLEQWMMKPNLRLRGLVYELVGEQELGLPGGQFPVNKESLQTQLRQQFSYSLPSPMQWRYAENQQYAHWYVTSAYHLALQYSLETDSKQFDDYLAWMYKTFPPDKYWYGTGHLIFAFLLSDAKKDTEAVQHLRGYAKEIDQKIKWMDFLSNDERLIRRQSLRQEVGMLLRTAQELDQMELMKQYEAQFRILFYE